jgi:hypothetical protein
VIVDVSTGHTAGTPSVDDRRLQRLRRDRVQGQMIYVDPLTDTVVVKLSYFPPGEDTEGVGEVLDFMRAASQWTPRT